MTVIVTESVDSFPSASYTVKSNVKTSDSPGAVNVVVIASSLSKSTTLFPATCSQKYAAISPSVFKLPDASKVTTESASTL